MSFDDLISEFQLLIEVPELYLANYFLDLRNQVDLVYAKLKHENVGGSDDNNDFKNIWLKMINKINLFEAICLKQLKDKKQKFTTRLGDDTYLTYNQIEHEQYEFKKELFSNETIFFLNSSSFNDTTNLLNDQKQNNKLIRVLDEYISDHGLEILKNSDNLEPNDNKLTQEFIKLKILKEFLKNSNQIDEIKLNLSNLRSLNLQKDIFNTKQILIKSIDTKTFSNLTNLIEINLTSNSIDRIESFTFHDLINLQELKLGFNQINHIDSNVFHNLISLKRLYLNNNRIKTLARDQFKNLINLKELYLYSNQIEQVDNSMFKNLNKLELLDMASNRLTYLETHTFNGLNNLKELDLRYNNLSLNDKRIFSCLTSLKALHLPSNLSKFYSLKLNPNKNG